MQGTVVLFTLHDEFTFAVLHFEAVELKAVWRKLLTVEQEDGLGQRSLRRRACTIDRVDHIVLLLVLLGAGHLGLNEVRRMEQVKDIRFGGTGPIVLLLRREKGDRAGQQREGSQ